jgi:hypothetical protein
MTDLQFTVLAGLLLWLLWRTRVVAQTSPWLRDALLRRIFEQLNDIISVVTVIPLNDLQRDEETWWQTEIRRHNGKGWLERRRCGPWCHPDWSTPGIARLAEIEYERTHPHKESEESRKEKFESAKVLAEHHPFDLGLLYARGWGVEKDQNEALRWYRKAAEQGDRQAQYNLAAAYFEGDGVPVDYETAYFWLKLRDRGFGVEAVGEFLTPDQRNNIEQRCREWVQSHTQGRNSEKS